MSKLGPLDELARLAKSAAEGWQAPEVLKAIVEEVPGLVARIHQLQGELWGIYENGDMSKSELARLKALLEEWS